MLWIAFFVKGESAATTVALKGFAEACRRRVAKTLRLLSINALP
jgi:hypothetical protein